MTFLNIDAMSVASKCSIIYYTPQGGGVFFLFKLEGCALKVGGVNPPRGSRNIPAQQTVFPTAQSQKFWRSDLRRHAGRKRYCKLTSNIIIMFSFSATLNSLKCTKIYNDIYEILGI